jgi:hypothetical protein
MKIRPVVAEFFHADGRTGRQTYMTKLIAAFRNFVNAPKKPAAATTAHLRDYQAESLRAIQRKTKYTFS